MKRYNPKEIESRWQAQWEKDKTFKVDIQKAKKPFYNLMMFPYPSGEGLHVGHVYAFGGADTFGRFKKMQGYDVFEPMGFDSFGIHSENYAIKVGKHPKKLIEETTAYFREKQLKKLGALFDWDHQVITSDPEYYRWTQWLFIQLFKAGLAVRKKAPVDWCPSCMTVLADEQVIGGRCERCGHQVIQKELEQWFFKITHYAQKLLDNLEWIDWSETTRTMQRNWIGRSDGAEIEFPIRSAVYGLQTTDYSKNKTGDGSQLTVDSIKVFTTRPDTVFGATFMVLAPEHPLIASLSNSKFKISNVKLKEVKDYVEKAKQKTESDREKGKTGVFTGLYCINPFTKKEIPVWVADYVLMGYGTGAIMAVPAHDARDYEFAKEQKLEIVEVISGGDIDKEAYVGEGKMVNSGEFGGLDSRDAIQRISNYIERNKLGRKTVNYHLRDWLISRQRYWGPPIPMIFCEACADKGKSWFSTDEAKHKFENSKLQNPNAKSSLKSKAQKFSHSSFDISHYVRSMPGWYPVNEEELPVELPHLENYQPRGKGVSPLNSLPEFMKVKCPECGSSAKRETDVSDTFLDSSWYFLRYPFVGYDDIPFGSKKLLDESTDHRLPSTASKDKQAVDRRRKAVDIARRWLPVDSYIGGNEHAVMHLLYVRFITMALKDISLVDFEEPFKKFRAHGLVIHHGAKMSKSRGNVVNPNEFIDSYGADTLRMYLLFLGPYDQGGDFSDKAIAGVFRFLNRVWFLINEVVDGRLNSSPDKELDKEVNKLIKSVGEDLEELKFNTAIASLMEYLNLLYDKKEKVSGSILKQIVILLAPFAPHIAEELWSTIGEKFSVHNQPWPKYDSKLIEEEVVTIVVQVNGRFRDKLEAPKDISEEEAARLALDREKIKRYTENKKVQKTIWIKGRLLNLVTGD